MSLPTDEELECRNRHILENEVLQDVVKARTPNEAKPVDEEAVMRFVDETEDEHAELLKAFEQNYSTA